MTMNENGSRRAARILCAVLPLALAACGGAKPESLVKDGEEAVAKQDYATAVIQFKAALQKDPQSIDARVKLGKALQSSGDAAGAAVEFTKALEQGADASKTVPLIAQALLRSGGDKKLVGTYDATVLQDKTAQAQLKTSLSGAWMNLGNREKARLAFDAASAAAPESAPVLIMSARQLAGRNDLPGAVALLDKLLAKDASQVEAWILKGALLSLRPKTAGMADAAYRKALELDKANAWAHFAIVNSLLRAKNLTQAKTEAKLMRDVLPKHALTVFADAQIAYTERDLPKARDLTQTLMQRGAANESLLQLAGSIALEMQDMIQAEAHFSKALQIAPELQVARLGLANVYLRQGQPTKVLTVLRDQIGADSTDGSALALAGEAELALGDSAGAEKYFSRASKIQPEDTRVLTALAMARAGKSDSEALFANLATVAASSQEINAELAAFSARMRRGEFDAALAVVDQIAKKQPANSAVHDMRGRVHLARRDLVQARKAFDAQVKADPNLFTATANLAAIDLIEGKGEDARKRLQAAVKADPRNVYAMLALTKLQSDAGAPLDEIKQSLSDAIKAAPRAPEPRLQLIALTLRKRLYKEALAAAQDAAAALPGDPTVMDAVGRAQMEAGDVEQAISTFRKMAGTETKSGLAYTRLADIYQKTGNREQAEAALLKALEVEPGLLPAQSALVDLLIRSKRNADALAFIQRQLRAAPDQEFGYSLTAAYHIRVREMDAAIAAYRTGLTKTNGPTLALGLHHLLGYLKKYDEADRLAASWLKDHPKDFAVAYQAADLAIKRNLYPQAQARLAELAVSNPDNPLILNNLASVMVHLGQPGALPYAQKAAAMVPDDARVLDTLAAALVADKQFDKALAIQKRTVALQPDVNEWRLRLADVALKANDQALAKAELTRLQGLGAKFKQQDEVTRLLKTL
jgi:putative PEP-CTERM system TPR-repeat lipoprotein